MAYVSNALSRSEGESFCEVAITCNSSDKVRIVVNLYASAE